MLNAFSLKNVAVEEESRITDQGRYNLAPMVHLNPKMMEKFDKHQFNHILFPTEELPMTVFKIFSDIDFLLRFLRDLGQTMVMEALNSIDQSKFCV